MKPTSNLLIVVLTFLALAASTFAQKSSPREQFQMAVTNYQQSATESNALKLAELYEQLDPSPAIPSDADYHAQKGAAFAELAKEPADFQRAITEFEQAIQLAPWVGEYHYNTALMLKSKGGVSDLEAAMRSIKLARLLAKDDKEKRDATALSAKLEVALEVTKESVAKEAKLATAKKSEEEKAAAAKAADTPQAREAALLKKVEGTRFVVRHSQETTGVPWTSDEILEIKDQTLHITIKIYSIEPPATQYGHNRPGEYLVDRISYRDGAFTQTFKGFTTVYRIRSDGQGLLRQCEGVSDQVIPRN